MYHTRAKRGRAENCWVGLWQAHFWIDVTEAPPLFQVSAPFMLTEARSPQPA